MKRVSELFNNLTEGIYVVYYSICSILLSERKQKEHLTKRRTTLIPYMRVKKKKINSKKNKPTLNS